MSLDHRPYKKIMICRPIVWRHVARVSSKHFAGLLMQAFLLEKNYWIFFLVYLYIRWKWIRSHHVFKEQMDNNIRHEVISYRYVLICFTRLLWFSRFLAEHFKSLCVQHWFWTSSKQLWYLVISGSRTRITYSRTRGYNHCTMFHFWLNNSQLCIYLFL